MPQYISSNNRKHAGMQNGCSILVLSQPVWEYRGTLTSPGRNSPDRDRSVEDNLRLFEEMRAGKHPEGSFPGPRQDPRPQGREIRTPPISEKC